MSLNNRTVYFIIIHFIYSIICVFFLLFIDSLALGGKCIDIKIYTLISSFLIIAPFITFIILCIVNIKDYAIKKFINKFALVSPILCGILIIVITSKTFEYASCFTPNKWRNKEIRYLMYDDMISKYNITNMKIAQIHKLLGYGEKSIPEEVKNRINKLQHDNENIEVYNLGETTNTFLQHYRGYMLILFNQNHKVINHEIFEIEI